MNLGMKIFKVYKKGDILYSLANVGFCSLNHPDLLHYLLYFFMFWSSSDCFIFPFLFHDICYSFFVSIYLLITFPVFFFWNIRLSPLKNNWPLHHFLLSHHKFLIFFLISPIFSLFFISSVSISHTPRLAKVITQCRDPWIFHLNKQYQRGHIMTWEWEGKMQRRKKK